MILEYKNFHVNVTKQPNSWLLTLRTTLFLNGKGQHRVETIYYSIAVAMGLKLDIYEILAYPV